MVNHHGAHLITRLRKYQTEIFASRANRDKRESFDM
jgi:hypothetical protein